jgi:hypothetical protein
MAPMADPTGAEDGIIPIMNLERIHYSISGLIAD